MISLEIAHYMHYGHSILAIILLIAAYYAYVIFKCNRLQKAWSGIIFALVLFALREIINFFVDMGLIEINITYEIFDHFIFPVLISVSIAIALMAMKKSFETFDVVEKKVQEKAQALSKSKKK